MKNNSIIFACLTMLLTWSCTKSDKDFVGKYTTYYATKIEIPDNINLITLRRGDKPKTTTTAKAFHDLGEIQIDLFQDQEKKIISGEAYLVRKVVIPAMFGATREHSEKIALDISNIRMNNDTLECTLDNQILKLQSKKITLRIVKRDNTTVIGISQEAPINNNILQENPFFNSNKAGFAYFNVFDIPIMQSKFRDFYQNQIKTTTSLMQQETDPLKKMKLANSLKELEAKIPSTHQRHQEYLVE